MYHSTLPRRKCSMAAPQHPPEFHLLSRHRQTIYSPSTTKSGPQLTSRRPKSKLTNKMVRPLFPFRCETRNLGFSYFAGNSKTFADLQEEEQQESHNLTVNLSEIFQEFDVIKCIEKVSLQLVNGDNQVTEKTETSETLSAVEAVAERITSSY